MTITLEAVGTAGTRSLNHQARIEVVELRALSALPISAVTATVPADPVTLPLAVTKLTCLIEVDRAHSGGKVKALPKWTFDTITARETAFDAAVSGVTPLVEDPVSIAPPTDAAVTRILIINVPPGATGFQLELTETGTDAAQPSIVGVNLTGVSDGLR